MLAGSWRALLVTGLFTSTALLLLAIPDTHGSLFDFRGGLYNAGRDIIHGQSPYQPAFLAHQVAIMRAGEIGVGETVNNPFSIPVYPAFAKLAVVPLSLLPFWLAGTLYTVLSIAAMIVGLGLLGVRDWRCIALALISWPFTFGLYLGALGPFLLLGAAIGFDGIAQYPQMLSNLSFIQEGRAVSLAAVLIAIGLSAGAAGIVALAAAGASWPRVAVRQAPRRGAHGIRPRHHRRSHRHPNRLGALHGPPVYPDRADLTPAVGDLVPPALHTMIIVGTAALVPPSTKVQLVDPGTLRSAILWLVLEALVLGRLCVSGSDVHALRVRLARGLPRPQHRPKRPDAQTSPCGVIRSLRSYVRLSR